MGFFDYDGAGGHGASAPLVAPEATFWANRSSADWRRFLDATQTLRYLQGETVLAPGATSRSVLLVLTGEAFAVGDPDRRWVEGQVLGLDSFFGAMPARTEVHAATDLEVARLSDRSLDALAAREAPLAFAITRELARLLAIESRQ